MASLLQNVVWLLFISLSSSTDLAAVYRDKILILRDADSIHPDSLSWEDIFVELPKPLSLPVALAHDAETNRLFVADTDPKEKAKIISISLNSTFGVVNMTTAVESTSVSVVEGMSYSPRSKHIYWTDATHHYIYKASVQSEDGSFVSTPVVMEILGDRISPRGLALDVCNEHLYWSEAGNQGTVPSSVEMWDPKSNKHHIFKKDEEKKDFYQGLTFDDTTRTLVWAVTHGDDLNSSCRIVSTSVDEGLHQDLVHLENCYPFSLTVDEKYVYWADWSRKGIMRASRSDPDDIARLLTTPSEMKENYLGAYGIAKLNVGKLVQIPCQDKEDKSHHEDKTEDSKSVTNEERGEDTAEIKKFHDDSSDNVESTKLKEEDDGEKTGEEIISDSSDFKEFGELQDGHHIKAEKIKNNIAEHAPTEYSGTENDKNNHNIYEDIIVKTFKQRNMLNGSQADSPSAEPEQKTNQESVDTATKINGDETMTDTIASRSTYRVSSTECVPRYSYIAVVVVLAATTVAFLCSTIILAVLLYRRRATSCKGISVAAVETPQAVVVQVPRKVKRFGPKKSFVTRNKSRPSGSSTCSDLANDGVNINIEDCCQMTLCETPCYTTVKKQGKSYKDIRKNSKNYEDKKGLLDDGEDI